MSANTDTNPDRKPATASHQDADGAKNRCGVDCIRPTPSQAHCGARKCHQTFGGVRGFDEHRKDGQCLDPANLGMALSDLGIWRRPMTDDARERLNQQP